MEKFSELLNKISSDNQSGSGDLLNTAITTMENYFSQSSYIKRNLVITELNKLVQGNPHFLVLFHFVNHLFLQDKLWKEEELDSQKILTSLRAYKNVWKNTKKEIENVASEIIEPAGKRILLHSNSSTIHSLFDSWSGQNLKISVVQTNSGPVDEGKIQAKAISEMGFKVNYITDAAMGRFVAEVDLAIVGADTVFHEKFMNKIGTYLLALACNHSKVPLYVISDSRKIIDFDILPEKLRNGLAKERKKPNDEMWKNPPNSINPINYYFENIPNNLVTGFITEKGVFHQEGLQDYTKEIFVSSLFDSSENVY